MPPVRLTDFREHVAAYFDQVIASRTPLRVTREGSEAMILLAEGEYASMQETLHLLASPTNAARLRESLDQLGERPFTETTHDD